MIMPPHHHLLQYCPEWFTFLAPAYPSCPRKKPLNGCSSSSCCCAKLEPLRLSCIGFSRPHGPPVIQRVSSCWRELKTFAQWAKITHLPHPFLSTTVLPGPTWNPLCWLADASNNQADSQHCIIYLCKTVMNLRFNRLQCFDTVRWASGRASGLQKNESWGAGMVICLGQGTNGLHMIHLTPLPPHRLLLH